MLRLQICQNRKTAPVLPAPERNPRKYCPGPEAVANISQPEIFYHKPLAPVQVLFLYSFYDWRNVKWQKQRNSLLAHGGVWSIATLSLSWTPRACLFWMQKETQRKNGFMNPSPQTIQALRAAVMWSCGQQSLPRIKRVSQVPTPIQ